ncbi:putative guanine nucleotide-exchange factor Sed4p [Monosporozyma servazzii]
MKYLASEYDVGYPLRGAKFLDDSILLVTGGGGQANRDIPNKLTALKVDFNKKKTIKRFREIKLDVIDDCPTTLDAAEVHSQSSSSNVILMGCNETTSGSPGSPNHHLRKFTFEDDHLKFIASADFNRSNNPNEYNKLTSLSSDGSVAAIASSKLPTVIRIIDPLKMEEKYEIESGNEVKDLHFSPDGKVICYITETTLEVISIVTGRFIIRKTDFNKQISLSKVRFLTNDVVAVTGMVNNKSKDITISTINIQTKNTKVILSKAITSGYTGITAMDASKDGQLIALATDKYSLLIVKSKDLSVTRSFKNIHQSEISSVVFSPNSEFVASVSLANTIHVVKLPQGLAQSTSFFHGLFKLLVNIVLTFGVIGIAYVAYYFNLHAKSFHYINEKYLTKRDTSEYFHMNDGIIETSTEILGDIVSVHTLTRDINSYSKVDTKEAGSDMSIITTSHGIKSLSTVPEVTSVIGESETTGIYEESLSLTSIDTTSLTKSEVVSSVSKISYHTSPLSATTYDVKTTSSITTDSTTSLTEPSNVSTNSSSTNATEIPSSVNFSSLTSMASSVISSANSSDSSPAISSEAPKSISIRTSANSSNVAGVVKASQLIESFAKTLTRNSAINDTISVSIPSPESSKLFIEKTVSDGSFVLGISSSGSVTSTQTTSKKEESMHLSSQEAKSTVTTPTKSVESSLAKAEKTTTALRDIENDKRTQVNSITKHTITVDGVVYEVISISSASTPSSLVPSVYATSSTLSTPSVLSNTSTPSNAIVSEHASTPSNAIVSEIASTPSNAIVSEITLTSSNAIVSEIASMSSNAIVSEIASKSDIKPTSQVVAFTTVAPDMTFSAPYSIPESTETLSSKTISQQYIAPSASDKTLSDVTSSIISSIVSEKSKQSSEITAKPAHYHTNVQSPNFRYKNTVSRVTVSDITTDITPTVSSSILLSIISERVAETVSSESNNIKTRSSVLSHTKETAIPSELAKLNEIEDNNNDIAISLAVSHSKVVDDVVTRKSSNIEDIQLEIQKSVGITTASISSYPAKMTESTSVSKASDKLDSTPEPDSSVVGGTNELTQTFSVEEEISEKTLKEEIDLVSDILTSHIRSIASIIDDEAPILTVSETPGSVVTTITDIGHDEL